MVKRRDASNSPMSITFGLMNMVLPLLKKVGLRLRLFFHAPTALPPPAIAGNGRIVDLAPITAQ